ncbi:hypothetical protein PR048_030720 [Dryococelus australis]|uniref:Uncharacterized protein n=1 Tax=Dryococelus australis TaxID=614101 RepID=A0ABQ9G9Q3_9NEOP|nr:hypothetical protein PR048_030720 [Dryococelus australis]
MAFVRVLKRTHFTVNSLYLAFSRRRDRRARSSVTADSVRAFPVTTGWGGMARRRGREDVPTSGVFSLLQGARTTRRLMPPEPAFPAVVASKAPCSQYSRGSSVCDATGGTSPCLRRRSESPISTTARTPALLVSVLELAIVLLVHTTPDTTLYFTAFIIGRLSTNGEPSWFRPNQMFFSGLNTTMNKARSVFAVLAWHAARLAEGGVRGRPRIYVCELRTNHQLRKGRVFFYLFIFSHRRGSRALPRGTRAGTHAHWHAAGRQVVHHKHGSWKHNQELALLKPGGSDLLVRQFVPHHCVPGSIPGGVYLVLLHVGIVPDDAAGRPVFSWISRFHDLPLRRCSILTLPHTLISFQEQDFKSLQYLSTREFRTSLRYISWPSCGKHLVGQIMESTCLLHAHVCCAEAEGRPRIVRVVATSAGSRARAHIVCRALHDLGSPLVDDRPTMNAVKHRLVSGVVWTNRTMASSNTDTNRTGVLAVVDIGDTLLICLKCQYMCADPVYTTGFCIPTYHSSIGPHHTGRAYRDLQHSSLAGYQPLGSLS